MIGTEAGAASIPPSHEKLIGHAWRRGMAACKILSGWVQMTTGGILCRTPLDEPPPDTRSRNRELPLLFCLCLLLAGCSHRHGTGNVQVTVIAVPRSVPPNSTLFLTGNLPEVGSLSGSGTPMKSLGDGRWSSTVIVDSGSRFEFAVTRGSWLSSWSDSANGDYPNAVISASRDTVVVIPFTMWRDERPGFAHLKADCSGLAEMIQWRWRWRYHPGDDSTWADPNLDERAWVPADVELPAGGLPSVGWPCIGWFRLIVDVDSVLRGKPLALQVRQMGASEWFMDGRRLFAFGRVGSSSADEQRLEDQNPRFILLDGKPRHLLAVRYSSFTAAPYWRENNPGGFTSIGLHVAAGDPQRLTALITESITEADLSRVLGCAIPFALAVLHLLLFVFYPRFKPNLYNALWMGGLAVLLYFRDAHQASLALLWQEIEPAVAVAASVFGLLTAYSLRYRSHPRRVILYLLVGLTFSLWNAVAPHPLDQRILTVYMFAVFVEIVLCYIPRKSPNLIRAEDRTGVWIVGSATWIFLALTSYDLLVSNEIIVPFRSYPGGIYVYGVLLLSIAFSINISRGFSGMHRDLERKLVQVQQLSAQAIANEREVRNHEIARYHLEMDNARKTLELEEARKLQLSMLPRTLPAVPLLEIAASMKTATEVGGDYYDFALADDGTLTIAIGDATGHGAKAGTLVAVTKGLFHELSRVESIPEAFRRCSSAIKSMNLGTLYMCLTIVKIREGRLTVSAAGMPPVLVYRTGDGSVESIPLKGMPLGQFPDFRYGEAERDLHPGDAVVLMSDGLPEMFNPEREILDYDGVQRLVALAGSSPAEEIIRKLVEGGQSWAGVEAQEDDVTLVVIKVKPYPAS